MHSSELPHIMLTSRFELDDCSCMLFLFFVVIFGLLLSYNLLLNVLYYAYVIFYVLCQESIVMKLQNVVYTCLFGK